MSTTPDVKISTFSRVLAWVVLALGMIAVVGTVLVAIKTGQTSDWVDVAMAMVPFGLVTLLFWIPAFKGRSPQWTTTVETLYDREANRCGIPISRSNSGRAVTFFSTSAVFGLLLIVFGQTIGVFEGETGWFAAAVFFAAWLVVVLILWRNFRKASESTRDS